MSDAAPPPWVRQLSLPSGAWRCLVGLWGFARYQTKGQTTVYPCRETLAEKTGQTQHAVAKQLRQLAERGWIHRPGKRGSTKAVLAWAEPFGQDGPVASQDGPPRTEVSPDTDGSEVDPGRSEVDPGRSDGWTQDGPQTSRELPENFQENVEGEAPATPEPSVNGAPVGETPEARLARLRAANHRDFKPANLSPELWQVIEACGFEPNARCATWCTRMVEAMGPKGYRVPPADQAAWLRRVLEAYELDPKGRPRADALWDYAGRKWLASVVKPKNQGNMSGGLVPVTTSGPNRYVTRAEARELRDAELAAQQGAP